MQVDVVSVRAKRADRVVELASGHHPFLSVPQAVADIVLTAEVTH